MLVTSEAIVLKSQKYSDTSKIVTLFTEATGKTTLIAKGARQGKNKFGTGLDPLNSVNVTFYQNPQRQLHLLSKVEIVYVPSLITDSLDRLTLCMAIIESVIKTQDSEVPATDLYALLGRAICSAGTAGIDPFFVFCRFHFELASLLGFSILIQDQAKLEHPGGPNPRNVVLSLENGCICVGSMAYNCFSVSTAIYNYLLDVAATALPGNAKPDGIVCDTAQSHTLDSNQKRVLINFWRRYFSLHLDCKYDFPSLSLYGD